jgi:phosphate starvation-inducible protein PhoH
VRHKIVADIVAAYEQHDERQRDQSAAGSAPRPGP